ncbi:conserved hypothetical protein [Sulfurimonas autotrophica DSM 16294]|uniref:Uncharacterized protein n=2 Tax=Sulfurimonas autotrophica TaxID=202747 RepID=E0UV56_SULAO|nr:conserved hypothetical protein [Sulfurimonas autotrophica DSM 16294]
MSRFYFFIWLQWAVKLTFYTFVLAFFMAIVITLGIYINQGLKPLDSEISTALLAIFKFWFVLSWSFALLIILFRSLKYIFNKCIGSYKFNLLTCPKEDKKEQTREIIVNIGYGDLLKVWRKWFMLIIWIVAAQMILALVIMKLFSSYENIFDWFNIYLLYIFILIAGYFSFIALNIKCKKVRITKC